VPTPAHTAAALTDGYSLAISVASVVLLAAGVVAMATLPSRHALTGPTTESSPAQMPSDDHLSASQLELDTVE
jgi:hypothetical protein